MTPTPVHLSLARHYREDGWGEVNPGSHAARHLTDAADALNMAMLTLDGPADERPTAKHRRVTHARKLLVEAVTALSRARLYVAGVRTYAVPVVMTGEASIDGELARLHQLCTRLLWFNHEYLPAKPQANPLTDEDEAQLALLFKDLSLQARIDRAMRHKWIAAAAISGALVPLLGPPLIIAAVACGAMALLEAIRTAPVVSSYSN